MILKYANGWKNLEISIYNCTNWTVAQQINLLRLPAHQVCYYISGHHRHNHIFTTKLRHWGLTFSVCSVALYVTELQTSATIAY